MKRFVLLVALALLLLLGLFLLLRHHRQAPAPSPRGVEGSSVLHHRPQAGNTRIDSFRTAKRHLHERVFTGAGLRRTLYCDCRYDSDKRVDHASCGFVSAGDLTRAARVEWEHVVPAARFGRSFPEWTRGAALCVSRRGKAYKGRRCAGKASEEYRRMEADMYNLFPSVGELNGLRKDYPLAEIPGEARRFGRCDFEVESGRAEPRPAVRGDIARSYLYMAAAYPTRLQLAPDDLQMLARWADADPVDAQECQRARRIAKIQGNTNRYVEEACRQTGL